MACESFVHVRRRGVIVVLVYLHLTYKGVLVSGILICSYVCALKSISLKGSSGHTPAKKSYRFFHSQDIGLINSMVHSQKGSVPVDIE